jgi:hypothetical protein
MPFPSVDFRRVEGVTTPVAPMTTFCDILNRFERVEVNRAQTV